MANDYEFDEIEYLAANHDVVAAVKAGHFHSGREHYDRYGKNEGRAPRGQSGKSAREAKVFYLLDKKGLGLEIGPSHNPIAPKRGGYNVHILDHASAAELRTKYQGHGVNVDNIEEVDYIWRGEPYAELIGKTNLYDWVIASHVIEHVPDLITYLQQCEALLKPTGILSLVIPDRRYCFDYFSFGSSTGNVLDAYVDKRTRPSHGQIFDQFSNASTRVGSIAWSNDGKGGADRLLHSFAVAQEHWTRSFAGSDYIDVHCWQFTPSSFRLLIEDLSNLGLINLEIKAEFDTEGCEFYVSLGKADQDIVTADRFGLLRQRKLENV